MINLLEHAWPYITAAITLLLTISTAIHAIVYKSDSRSAVGWVGLIWLVPLIGPLLYLLLGINRIHRRVANRLDLSVPHCPVLRTSVCAPSDLAEQLPSDLRYLAGMARLNEAVTKTPLMHGNEVRPLINGDEAYPAMLDAIEKAERSISLTTYIFGNDRTGRRFVSALAKAVQRGVEVRVLIDSVGSRYSLPPVTHRLRVEGVRTARFMPTYLPWATPYFNLRTHRKIMVVDGVTAFTGGMNIRDGNILSEDPYHPTMDIHFLMTGPVVRELQESFTHTWAFTTGEHLNSDLWFPNLERTGDILARGISDGPDKDYDKMRLALHGALSVAQTSVQIMTPYFLPDASLITALNTCAMRGVDVDIIIPEVNNLKMVAWASQAQLWQNLEWGCRIHLKAPPFDHSKLLIVDQAWSLIGSANWDPRSLRLNFEFGVECYSQRLATQLSEYFDQKLADCRPITLDEVNGRSLPIKVRDGVARLFSPYL